MLPGLSALTSLDLSDNPFEALAALPDGLQALSTLPSLQVRADAARCPLLLVRLTGLRSLPAYCGKAGRPALARMRRQAC